MRFLQSLFDPPKRQVPDNYLEQAGWDTLALKIDPECQSEIDPA
jgi:hypothetical protein